MAKISKKKKFSNFIVILAIVSIIAYTAVCLVILFTGGSLEGVESLTENWYDFWTTEVFALACIKTFKVIRKSDDDE